ncbi:MAG: hypothetical protein ACI8RD_014217, partial [Bacillariaceae sp.]
HDQLSPPTIKNKYVKSSQHITDRTVNNKDPHHRNTPIHFQTILVFSRLFY